jgi:nicotinamide-nucleotide amidase
MADRTVASDAEIAELVPQLSAQLRASGQSLATAESCTGGWIGKVLTDLPGSSDWYAGGVVSYSNGAKQNLLGVPAALIAVHGAVSEPVALAMAEGVRTRFDADLAVAVSGIAGPGGGSAEKPVGTVWIAWADAWSACAQQYRFSGEREAVRRATVAAALAGLLVRQPAARA